MSRKILERSDDVKAVEQGVKNKWKWAWLELKDSSQDYLSEYIRKVDKAGQAICTLCNKTINYSQSGKLIIIWIIIVNLFLLLIK